MNNDFNHLVEVRDLVKRYGRGVALDSISLEIERGSRTAILGPNGAGKTSLIHILCTIQRADSGTVTVAGHEVHRNPRRARQNIGVVFQEGSLDTRLTVVENLEFHGRVFGVPKKLRRERIESLLEMVELSSWRDHLVRNLSKGMQRRLEIARALVHDASLLVLDEPTVGLDAQTRGRMWRYLEDLQRQRDLTVLVTTHYIEEVDHCDQVLVVDHGKLLTSGSPAELKDRYGSYELVVVPRDDAAREAIVQAHPKAQSEGSSLRIALIEASDADSFLQHFGTQLSSFRLEAPTLEGVFLGLTGRGLRDQGADRREAMLAGPRSGGEPVR